MFQRLKKINHRPGPYAYYTAETLWNDAHISKKMLAFHLDENSVLASRKPAFIYASVAWIAHHFDIKKGVHIADFGCGPGLYAIRFAEKGAMVTGIDFSERSLAYAREVAEKKNQAIDYVRCNYLDFVTDKKFDLITMIYCDFCALSPAQRKIILKKFHACLKDNGAVLLDVCAINAFHQLEEKATYQHLLLDGFWSPDDYYGFLNTFKYDTEKVTLDKYTIIEKSRTREIYNWLQHYSQESIRKEFEENGFHIAEWYADVAGSPYKPNTTEFAVVAKKL